MPLSTSAEFLTELAANLRAELPESNLQEVQVGDDLPPLLILEKGHLVAAFALGHDEHAYDVYYPAFKKHFASKGSAWNAKDVSFVYCLPETQRPSEEFCSRVEVDVYFCRKFVVLLGENVGASLLRLPFLPLAPVTGQQLRQPPAATFLQSFGTKAELATNLVKPGRGSAATILANCLTGRFGEPVIELQKPSKGSSGNSHAVTRTNSTLKSLSIQNFRAYRKAQEFEFGSAITVLYGPNGFGKTSFFDALDFAATGGVARFSRSGTAFNRAVRHLDCSGQEKTVVQLKFNRDGTTHTLTRDLDDLSKATLDGRSGVDRKEVLNLLTGSESSSSDRVDHLVSLFRATHLFGQDNQALTENFAGTCEVSAELVSRMLAFEDYVSAVNKASAVHQAAKEAVTAAEIRTEELRAQVASDKAELDRLAGAASAGMDTRAIDALLPELNEAARVLGIDVEADASVEKLRSLRLVFEERLGALELRREKLTDCVRAIAARGEVLNELSEARKQAAELSTVVAKASEQQQRNVSDSQTAPALLASANQNVATHQRRLNSIEWSLSTKSKFDELTEGEKRIGEQLNSASQARFVVLNSMEVAAARLGAARTQHQQASAAAATSVSVLENLSQLKRRAVELRDVDATQARLMAQIAVSHELIARFQEQALTLRQSVTDESGHVARLQRLISEAQQRDSELRALVSQLRQHVTDGVCVFCAHDHGSIEVLLNRIDSQTPQSAELPELVAQLAMHKDIKASIEEQMADVERKLQIAYNNLSYAMSERGRLDGMTASFMQSLAVAGIQSPGENATPIQVEKAVQDALDAEEQRRNQLVSEVQECYERLQRAMGENASESAMRDSIEAIIKRHEVALSETRAALQRIAEESQTRQVDLTLSLAELTLALGAAQRSLEDAKAVAQAAQLAADQAIRGQKETDARLDASRNALRLANGRVSTAEGRLGSIVRILVDAGLSEGADDVAVKDASSLIAMEISTVSAYREKAEVIEMAIDAAATAASLQSIKNRMNECAVAISAAEQEAKRNKPWVNYFGRLATALQDEQSKATRYFTEQYGPRTAVIQQRLRPVYGFEDIDVSTHGASIAVRVKRKGESHMPTDYFSQSQVQTLLLGLFLTACSSQTWSGFSSVLMDDPVTHFDDLNTYALLDLLSGLVHSPEGGRQFVISTCDEKLLQLARQKFRHLGTGARFYRFSALGAEGPYVSEIPS